MQPSPSYTPDRTPDSLTRKILSGRAKSEELSSAMSTDREQLAASLVDAVQNSKGTEYIDLMKSGRELCKTPEGEDLFKTVLVALVRKGRLKYSDVIGDHLGRLSGLDKAKAQKWGSDLKMGALIEHGMRTSGSQPEA